MLAVMDKETCLLVTFHRLFIMDPQSPNTSLFYFNSKVFWKQNVVVVLRKKLVYANLKETEFS